MADELIRRMALASCKEDRLSLCYCRKYQIHSVCRARAQACLDAAGVDELVSSLTEMKELFRLALLNTTPEIARDGMEFIKKAEAALAAHRGGS